MSTVQSSEEDVPYLNAFSTKVIRIIGGIFTYSWSVWLSNMTLVWWLRRNCCSSTYCRIYSISLFTSIFSTEALWYIYLRILENLTKADSVRSDLVITSPYRVLRVLNRKCGFICALYMASSARFFSASTSWRASIWRKSSKVTSMASPKPDMIRKKNHTVWECKWRRKSRGSLEWGFSGKGKWVISSVTNKSMITVIIIHPYLLRMNSDGILTLR